jgi:hypothetical protein
MLSAALVAGVPVVGTLAVLAIGKFYAMGNPQEFEGTDQSGTGEQNDESER